MITHLEYLLSANLAFTFALQRAKPFPNLAFLVPVQGGQGDRPHPKLGVDHFILLGFERDLSRLNFNNVENKLVLGFAVKDDNCMRK